jgi:bacteriorhodopsin
VWQAVTSACQVLFMISKAPRVPWEAIYLPATEAISYVLSYNGEGYVRLATGKVLPWCRMAAWLCTCPIMLGLVSNMALIKYKSQPLNPMMGAASIIRTVFGISATMAHEEHIIIWTHAFIAFLCFGFEMVCALIIFALIINDFQEVGSPLALRTVGRLQILRLVFFLTWCAFPILWLVSSTYACLIHERECDPLPRG